MLSVYVEGFIRWHRTGNIFSVLGVAAVLAASNGFLSNYQVVAFVLLEPVRRSGSDASLLHRSSDSMTVF